MPSFYREAKNLYITGRYYYINLVGYRHSVNIRKENGKTFVIFDDNGEIDRDHLRGKFYYRP